MQTNRKKVKLTIFFLTLVFILPVIVSWIFYSYPTFFNFKTTNHGALIHPSIQLEALKIKSKKWQIVYFATDCDDKAKTTFYNLHQLQKALGKNQKRVSLTFVTNATCSFKQDYEFHRLVLSRNDTQELQNLLQASVIDKIYLIDPIGNIFMYYPSDVNAMNILKDMKKVLEVSQIG